MKENILNGFVEKWKISNWLFFESSEGRNEMGREFG